MWKDFGFERNPYDTHPVKGDAVGERLLVGRDPELRSIKNRIQNIESVVTVEGPNGVGKTSLVLVAGHQLEKQTASLGKNSLILIPDPFQFTHEDDATSFKRKVYAEIASYFIANEKNLRARLDLQFNLYPLRQWLENPVNYNGSVQILSTGASGGVSPNTSSGFDLHGFFSIVDRLLSSAFQEMGGVICVLDNLEILNTSQAARQRLEALRDDLFSKHGIKWVVCGARGIVKSVASSPRLQGRLQEPLEVKPLLRSTIQDLLQVRVSEYSIADNSTPPVGTDSFSHVFVVLNENLRDALKFSGDFAAWLYDNNQYTPNPSQLHELFEVWLAEQSESFFGASHVPPRAWRLFDDICNSGGSISPSDYESYDFNSSQNMRGAVAKLEGADFVSSEIDETDHRRKTISVTAKGWLVQYHRSGYQQ